MKKQSGFSLFELIVVIAVVTMFVSVAMPTVSKIFASGRQATTKLEMRNIIAMTIQYEEDKGSLPTNLKKLNNGYMTGNVTDDSFGLPYIYHKHARKLCSKGIILKPNQTNIYKKYHCLDF